MPILMHGLTPDGIDAIEDALDCIALLLYYRENNKGLEGQATPISPEMWHLLPQILHIVGGKPGDVDGGFAFEYLNLAVLAIQNYVAKDPETLISGGQAETPEGQTYLQQLFLFL